MSEFEPKPQHEIDSEFNELVDGFSMDSQQPPAISEQQEILSDIQEQHRENLQESGILAVVVDRVPESFVGNGDQPRVSLRRVMHRHPSGADITEADISVGYWDTKTDGTKIWHTMQIPVAQEIDNEIRPLSGFDQSHADLAFSHIEELAGLKKRGVLPNLNPNLDTIYNPNTGLSARQQ